MDTDVNQLQADDSEGYSNGAALYVDYLTTQQPGYSAYPYPAIPTPDQFVSSGRNKRVSFFGSACESSPKTRTPLIVYFPNYDAVYPTNSSASDVQYPVAQQAGFYANGFAIGSANATCLACAMVDAQMTRNGVSRTAQCEACFEDFCFNA